jgi:hypothetical protein
MYAFDACIVADRCSPRGVTDELSHARWMLRAMNEHEATIEFTLQPPRPGAPVSVRLRRYLDRWVAELVGTAHPVAVGITPREALTVALTPLGDTQVRLLLADLGLLEPSIAVATIERRAG